MLAVRAGMVRKPNDYRWSSFAANALGHDGRMVQPHPAYLALGSLAAERHRTYRLPAH